MKKKKTERPARPGRPLPAYTEYTHAGMRRDSVRPVVRTPVPDDESVVEEMHWVMENKK